MEKTFETRYGYFKIEAIENFITKIHYCLPEEVHTIREDSMMEKGEGLLDTAYRQLEEYLAGEREIFDFPMNPQGTEFQKKVWQALKEIPYGETRTYKEIAIAIGNPKACRAVGMANNKNPIIIAIPCHRVIGANGKLVGYAGGMEMKKMLLTLEGTF